MADVVIVGWNSPRLNKGQAMYREVGDAIMSITRPDRSIDPYFACVMVKNIVTYTGLHPTLSDARKKCETYLPKESK